MEQSTMCKECEGTGSAMPEGCQYCEDSGWVDDPEDGGTMTCPECDGLAAEDCLNNCEGGYFYTEN